MNDLSILHLYADTGVEDEVLHTFGEVTRIGIDPDTNPFSTVIKADARNPPIAGQWDLALAHPPCQRWSVATEGGASRWDTDGRDEHPDLLDDAREVCRRHADHYIIENVEGAPLRDPVRFTGGMFGMPIHYPRAFETSFKVEAPSSVPRWRPTTGPLSEQGKKGNAWVGTNDGWRIAKGYSHQWPARGLKRHAVPAPYLRRLMYWYLAAVENGERSEQPSLSEVTA